MIDHAPLFIDGRFVAGVAGTVAETPDPATGATIATFDVAGPEDVDRAVAAAQASVAAGTWRRLRPFERGRTLAAIGRGLADMRDRIARTIVLDSGKPLRDAYWEVDCSARFFEYYGGLCDKLLGTSVPLGPGLMDWTIKEPIGVSAQIVPWNYPLQVAVRGVAPALAAGCSVVVKPAMETPASMGPLLEIMSACGVPRGVVNVVTGPGDTVGEVLAGHPGVDQVTFTGSVTTGVKVLRAAARHVVPTVMELGGKSPQLLFADADLDTALPTILAGMFTHAGQVCNAGTRLLVDTAIHDAVVDRLHHAIQTMSIGAGLDDPDLGPLASARQRDAVSTFADTAEHEGDVLWGAPCPSEGPCASGFFASPAIVTGLRPSSVIAREEIFGPLLAVLPFTSTDEAIAMANDSPYGLVAGVFTDDMNTAMRCAVELQAGQVWVNGFGVAHDVEFPFGGYKRSGFGREKGVDAVNAYLQVKNVCVQFEHGSERSVEVAGP